VSKPKQKQKKPRPDARAFLAQIRPVEFHAIHLREPRLVFGGGIQEVDPKTGLALHGPFDIREPGRHSSVRVGIVGTGAMIDATLAWVERCRLQVPAVRLAREENQIVPRPMDPSGYPPFPGLKSVFEADFIADRQMIQSLGGSLEAELRRIPIFEPRITRLVDLIIDRLRVLAEQTVPPDIVICALPTEIRKLCTTPSRHTRRGRAPLTIAEALRRAVASERAMGQVTLFDPTTFPNFKLDNQAKEEQELEEQSVFHHGLKARAMQFGIPTQLAWQSTFEGGTSVEDQATRAWNFWTAVYYKAGGVPWHVQGLDRTTCYVGISFYKDKRDQALHSCMAQAFSASGEGLVLRSEPFRRDPQDLSRTPHLPKPLAGDLMARVLKAYRDHTGQPPGRVVVHKWQRYTQDEHDGLRDAIGTGASSCDLVAFGDRGIRFFRTGMEPPLRGTMIPLSPTNALLYTRGYVHYLGEYPGMRVPRPIEIVEHYGDSSLTKVCEEVLALSKLDWNTAAFASKDPITTAFASDVGHILAELPASVVPRPQYRFYM